MSVRRAAPVVLALLALLPAREPARGGFDLDAFSRLPVLHAGRVKPLDTVARTSLLEIQGRQRVSQDGRSSTPAEWLLNALARPETADVQRIFRVDDPDLLGLMGKPPGPERYYSYAELEPALEAISAECARAERLDERRRGRLETAALNLRDRLILYQRLKNTLRIEGVPDWSAEVARYRRAAPAAARAMSAHLRGGPVDPRALAGLAPFFERFRFVSRAAAFWALPAPDGGDGAGWSDLGESLLREAGGGAPHPGVDAYARLAAADRAGDAASFNDALRGYASWIAARRPAEVRLARLEVLFNRCEPFYRGMILYVAALFLVLASWAARPDLLRRTATDLLWLAFAVHTAGLAFRVVLQGRPPVTNLYSSAVFVGWGAVLLGLLLERAHRDGYGALAASASGFLTLIVAHHLANQGDTMEMMRAVLDSNFWLATHVVAITAGYSAMFVASALAHVLILRRWLRPGGGPDGGRSLAAMTYGAIRFALFFSFAGTILGGIWADRSWGRFWGWDPKENGALLIVLWCAIILHARWGGYARERGIAVMAVFGGVVTALSWFGVNMLGVGLHSYGFMEEAFDWLAAFVALELAVMALGWWAVPASPPRPAS